MPEGVIPHDKRYDGKKILDVYNVKSADDIVSIEVVSPYEKNIFGATTPKVVNTITKKENIEGFYPATGYMKGYLGYFKLSDKFKNF